MRGDAIPFLYLVILLLALILWLIGEATDKPWLRRICGPLFALLLAAVVGGAAILHTSSDDSIQYSGAMKQFVSALLSAIDRGDSQMAHEELRRFNEVSIETYEGGALMDWLSEPLERLSPEQLDEGNPAKSKIE